MTSASDQEKTFYNIPRLHWIFAVCSLLLLAATIAMFVEDHFRTWKQYQRRSAEIDVRTTLWLQQAAEDQDDAAQQDRLEHRILQQRSTYFVWDGGFPWLGKRWLELPVLDAFNSPRRIETLWAEDLTQDYHYREVLRYDRCTTCHQRIQTPWPGDTSRPLYPPAQTLTLQLRLPENDSLPEAASLPADESRSENDRQRLVEKAFGLVLTESGFHNDDPLTVVSVAEGSLAAKAGPPAIEQPLRTRDEIETLLMGAGGTHPDPGELAGLWMGDQILEVDGQPIRTLRQWTETLFAAWQRLPSSEENREAQAAPSAEDATAAAPRRGLRLTVRRGLAHPYAAHPRLDLYVGSSSPHPMSDFGCTVCHGGQGSATSFTWASHTPDSDAERLRWRQEHGWLANEFWLEPMLPARFAESACLKCHHHVVDLAASERFPQPPAAKLLRGYELVLRHGCYGCHEITGVDNGRRLGPDLRVEPFQALSDQEHPGTLRRPGPSLRHLASKLDGEYVRRWIAAPSELQPEARMPHSFGNLAHIPAELQAQTILRESVEVAAAVHFLLAESQPLELLEPAEGDDSTTAEQQAQRGRDLFQTTGCLVCHKHRDFEDAEPFRDGESVADGSDLSNLGAYLRGPDARRWLYTWIKQPERHDPRTVMPAMNLPITPRRDSEGQQSEVSDPVADLVEYLLPRDGQAELPQQDMAVDGEILDQLVLEHWKREFPESRAIEYRDQGIPLDREAKLLYLGRKTVAWHGCYGCHEIPGFEGTQPIGIELNDWGRKEPRMLAFEHVADYVAGQIEASPDENPDNEFYLRHLRGENRIGFLHQKLAEPRSFDYGKLDHKPWNDRLRMPQYRFSAEQREAVMTFVLGLVAQPPRPRYLHQPAAQQLAILEGRKILDQYHCRGCHALRAPRWQLEFPPGTFDSQPRQATFPFVTQAVAPREVQASLQPDRRGLLSARLTGMPAIADDGRPMVFDDFGDELFDDDQYDVSTLEYAFQLWEPAALEGHDYQVGEAPLYVLASQVAAKSSSDGGFLPNYLLPHVVRREREVNPNAKGSEAWGWLPPPLHGLGQRVQTPWLRDYLLDPYRMRPATVMPMPRFALSPQQAERLARYFAAVDGMDEHFDSLTRRSTVYLQQAERDYQQRWQQVDPEASLPPGSRLDHAMQILANRNFCITCHIVGAYDPQTSDRAKAADLAAVHHRLRPDWLRRWLGKPVSLVPYTGMPVNIPYHSDQPHLGGVDQGLYQGTSIEQLDALVDLLLNFDTFAAEKGTEGLFRETP